MTRERKDSIPFSELARGSHLVEPPKGTFHKAIALRTRLPRGSSVTGWIVRCLFDSGGEAAAVGVRSAGVGERRLLFEAADDRGGSYQMDLRVRRDGRSVGVVGQVLPPPAASRVTASTSPGRGRSVVIGGGGEFELAGMRWSRETLTLTVESESAPLFVVEVPATSEPDGSARGTGDAE